MNTIRKGLLAAGLLLGSAGLVAAAPAAVEANLNLRAGPGSGYRVVTVMPAGSTVETLGCTGNWCRVAFRGMTGYASARYLDTAYASRGFGAFAAAPPIFGPPLIFGPPRFVGPRPYWRDRSWRDRSWAGRPHWRGPHRRW